MTTSPEPREASAGVRVRSPWEQAWRRLSRNRAAMASLGFLAVMLMLSLLAPWIAPLSLR